MCYLITKGEDLVSAFQRSRSLHIRSCSNILIACEYKDTSILQFFLLSSMRIVLQLCASPHHYYDRWSDVCPRFLFALLVYCAPQLGAKDHQDKHNIWVSMTGDIIQSGGIWKESKSGYTKDIKLSTNLLICCESYVSIHEFIAQYSRQLRNACPITWIIEQFWWNTGCHGW
jgi:hypothetical protein